MRVDMKAKLLQIFTLGSLLLAILLIPKWYLGLRYGPRIHPPEEAPSLPIAVVFGAGLRRDGRPTAVLADRVATAAELYLNGKTDLLILSGSKNSSGYDEAEAMRSYAQELGVPPEHILIDSDGDRTFSTCLNLKDKFGVQEALLITQRFHLPRALVLCDSIGLQTEGVTADLREYPANSFWSFRETVATLRALWDAGKYRVAAS